MESRVRSSQSAFCEYPSCSRSRHMEPNGENWFCKVLAFAWVDQILLKMASENTAKSFAFFDFLTLHESPVGEHKAREQPLSRLTESIPSLKRTTLLCYRWRYCCEFPRWSVNSLITWWMSLKIPVATDRFLGEADVQVPSSCSLTFVCLSVLLRCVAAAVLDSASVLDGSLCIISVSRGPALVCCCSSTGFG